MFEDPVLLDMGGEAERVLADGLFGGIGVSALKRLDDALVVGGRLLSSDGPRCKEPFFVHRTAPIFTHEAASGFL